MALLGNLDTNFGVVGEYHIIVDFKWSKFGDISVTVFSYKDQIARNNLNDPLAVRTYMISNNPIINDLTIAFLYDQLKLKSDFSDMIDA